MGLNVVRQTEGHRRQSNVRVWIIAGFVDADQSTQIPTVIAVAADGPAARAGVQVGDVIVGMDGHDVRGNGRSMLEYFLRVPVGTLGSFVFARGLKVSLRAA